jgi:hypothetical protein
MLTVVADGCPGHESGKGRSPSLIDEIVHDGARRMLAEALQAEVEAYIAQFGAERGDDGRLVVRNGYHQSREVLTSPGAVEVTAPRVNDKRTDRATGERMRFCSVILPPWYRKTPKVTEVLPLLWRAVNAPHLVALVRAGATFTGKLAERPDDQSQPHGPEK